MKITIEDYLVRTGDETGDIYSPEFDEMREMYKDGKYDDLETFLSEETGTVLRFDGYTPIVDVVVNIRMGGGDSVSLDDKVTADYEFYYPDDNYELSKRGGVNIDLSYRDIFESSDDTLDKLCKAVTEKVCEYANFEPINIYVNDITKCEKLKTELYEQYKSEWLKEMVTPEMQKDTERDYEENKEGYSSFDEYIWEQGYGGSLYVCYDEFIDCEYSDVSWLAGHITKEQAYLLAENDEDFPLSTDEIEMVKFKTEKQAKQTEHTER